jgi:hypothetical protein
MTTAKAAAIETGKLQKAFKQSVEGQNYVGVALAMFKDAFTQGLREEHARRQSEWPALSPRYLAWKRKAGLKTRAWEMTGGTLQAVTNSAPAKIGMTGKIRFGLNFKSDVAFAMPRAFKKAVVVGKGKDKRKLRLGSAAFQEYGNAEFQERVYSVMRYGNRRSKVSNWAQKSGKNARIAAREKFGGFHRNEGLVPARPWLTWSSQLIARAEAEVARKVAEILRKEGMDAKVA